jgi:hypothetical protein
VLLVGFIAIAFASTAWAQAASPPPAAGPGGYPAQAQPPAQPQPPPAQPPPAADAPPPPAPYGAYPPPVPPLQPPFSGQPGPVVRLNASHPRAQLQEMRGSWMDVCRMPCGVPVNPAGLFRVGGGTFRGSEPFHMPRPAGEVLVDARMGSNIKHWVGFALMLGGIGGLAAGSFLLATPAPDSYSTTMKDAVKADGVVGVITGVVLLAVGIPLFAMNNTSVDVR